MNNRNLLLLFIILLSGCFKKKVGFKPEIPVVPSISKSDPTADCVVPKINEAMPVRDIMKIVNRLRLECRFNENEALTWVQ